MSVVDPDQWQRIKRLFQDALEQPPAQRIEFVRQAAQSAEMASEVIALLAAHERDTGRDETRAAAALEQLRVVVPEQIGPYRPLRVIVRGGMGVVWLAERIDGAYQQRVALKRLAAHLSDPVARERFQRERETLARLDHPHIARLLDGGIDAQGLPWFAMTYVEGAPITQWCDAQRLGLNERLRRMQQVLDALDAAHRQLVVHPILDEMISSGDEISAGPFKIAFFIGVPKPKTMPGKAVEPDRNKGLMPIAEEPKIKNVEASMPPAQEVKKEEIVIERSNPQLVKVTTPAIPPVAPKVDEKPVIAATPLRPEIKPVSNSYKKIKKTKTFAPPSEIQNLKSHLRPGKGGTLEVIVAWKERILSAHHFQGSQVVRVNSRHWRCIGFWLGYSQQNKT